MTKVLKCLFALLATLAFVPVASVADEPTQIIKYRYDTVTLYDGYGKKLRVAKTSELPAPPVDVVAYSNNGGSYGIYVGGQIVYVFSSDAKINKPPCPAGQVMMTRPGGTTVAGQHAGSSEGNGGCQ